eukprot:2159814-Rhodomonas_salina.1
MSDRRAGAEADSVANSPMSAGSDRLALLSEVAAGEASHGSTGSPAGTSVQTADGLVCGGRATFAVGCADTITSPVS